MTCIDNLSWKQAQLSCNAVMQQAASVKGFGYTATGLAGLRGLGLGDPSTDIDYTPPAAVSAPAASNPMMSAAAVAAMAAQAASQAAAANSRTVAFAPAVVSSPINSNDPCSVASQGPCPGPATCPTGNVLRCESVPTQTGATTICYCAPLATAPPATTTTTTTTTAAGGFSHWGLLAALAVGGGALYLVMKKKHSA